MPDENEDKIFSVDGLTTDELCSIIEVMCFQFHLECLQFLLWNSEQREKYGNASNIRTTYSAITKLLKAGKDTGIDPSDLDLNSKQLDEDMLSVNGVLHEDQKGQ